jgi:hypothetical protein
MLNAKSVWNSGVHLIQQPLQTLFIQIHHHYPLCVTPETLAGQGIRPRQGTNQPIPGSINLLYAS